MKLFPILLLIFSIQAFANWLGEETKDLLYTENVEIDVEKDGSYLMRVRIEVTPLTLDELEYYKKIVIAFNKLTSKAEILKIQRCRKKKCKQLPLKGIVHSEKNDSSGQGATGYLKYLVPDFQVHDKLIYTYTLKKDIPSFKGLFSYFDNFGVNDYEVGSSLEIRSKIALHLKINKKDKFEVKKKSPFHLIIKQKKPLYYNYQYLNDTDFFLSEANYPYIKVSSIKSWEKLGDLFSKSYSKKIDEVEFPKIDGATPLAKAMNIASHIKDNYTYLGAWRRKDGAYVPRSLKEVLDSKYGDCKDLSLLFHTWLKAAGIESSIAAVLRDSDPDTSVYDIPALEYFSHVVVVFKLGNEIHWHDPTNASFDFNYVPQDIIGKNALVFSGSLRGLRKVFNSKNGLSMEKDQISYKKEKDGFKKIHKMIFFGNKASFLDDMYSKFKNESEIKKYLADGAEEYSSRNLKEISINLGKDGWKNKSIKRVHVSKTPLYYHSNNGAIQINKDTKSISNLYVLLMKPELIYRVPIQSKFVLMEEFQGMSLSVDQAQSCSIKNKWFEFEFKVEKEAGKVTYIRETTFKEDHIFIMNKEDLNSLEQGLKDYESCYKGRAFMMNIVSK